MLHNKHERMLVPQYLLNQLTNFNENWYSHHYLVMTVRDQNYICEEIKCLAYVQYIYISHYVLNLGRLTCYVHHNVFKNFSHLQEQKF